MKSDASPVRYPESLALTSPLRAAYIAAGVLVPREETTGLTRAPSLIDRRPVFRQHVEQDGEGVS
jgi:hypothetical protein